jgi:hypothetical protein
MLNKTGFFVLTKIKVAGKMYIISKWFIFVSALITSLIAKQLLCTNLKSVPNAKSTDLKTSVIFQIKQ